MPTTIIHHANCPDGFGSAWLMNQTVQDATIIAASYGDPLPPEVHDADVIIVDFCYPTDQLLELQVRARSCLILDHHQTSLNYLEHSEFMVFDSVTELQGETFSGPVFVAVLDMSRSGVGLVMQFTGKQVPFLHYVEDRDLWKFQYPDTPDMFAAVTSQPYTIQAWDDLEAVYLPELLEQGKAINRYRDKLIADTVATARMALLPTGHRVWVVASPYAIGSDVAGELAKRTPELFAAYYVDSPDSIRFGLRSTPEGMDVAEIAEQLGGGGHKHASGFEITRKWEGWT